MADPPAKRQKKENNTKSKSYHTPYAGNRRHLLEIGHKGFLATCNFREKDCVRECYNVLSQYADQFYGPEAKSEGNKNEAPKDDTAENEEETDISDDLQKEIDAAQAQSKSGKCRRFQAVDTGTKNCIFIKTTLDDPVELGVKLIKDIAEKKLQKTRFLLRLTPIEKVCRADVDDISKAGDSMFDKYFLGAGKTFSVVYNKRYNNDIKRDEVIKVLADKILEMNPKNKVDLKNPELSVIVEIVKGKCCLSVVEGYMKYRKYNLVELAAVKAENGGVKEEAIKADEEQSAKEEKGAVEDVTEDDSSAEDKVRDVPVGEKLKELLERKKTSEYEPDAKKIKADDEDKETPEEPNDE